MKKTFLAAIGGILLTATLSAGAQVYVRVGPPPPVVERRPPVPYGHPNWAWQNGYHRWNGNRYVWIPGRYYAPPRAGVRWYDGRWEHRGGGYYWHDGYWR